MASIEEIREARLKKIKLLEEKGINPYPSDSKRELSLAEVWNNFSALEESKEAKWISGRIMSIRGQGAIIFITLNDGTGHFQGLLKKDILGDEKFDFFNQVSDIGDFVELQGTFFTTNRGEKSLEAKDWRMLSKSLRPLPEKWHGLTDIEERFRKRYLDLLASPEVKERFVTRSKTITLIREFYLAKGFVEVDVPYLQPLAGGATAAPFKTTHNALGREFFLPIAQELYLKELLAGGMPKVFELGKRFRNEGIDTTHNPEFTMLESNEAYADAESLRNFTQELFRHVVKGIFGTLEFEYDGQKISLAEDFEVMKYPHISDEEYKKELRPTLIQPTFLVDYPVAFNPFAKRKDDNPDLIDRFQLVMAGTELVNAFSELNNPIDQRERYVAEDKKGKAGNKEISPSDQEYLEAMEYGMPPNGGIGIGIDRLVMLLTNVHNIKEVILFPTLKPKD